MRLRSHLSIVVVLACAALAGAAAAQEWSLDTKSLDTGALGAAAPAKSKKAGAAVPRQDAGGKPDKGAPKTENRQFGELEGWSPGKSPPKKKDKGDDAPRFGKAPVNMNSTGGMGVGMPF